jgi:hypothetical protein
LSIIVRAHHSRLQDGSRCHLLVLLPLMPSSQRSEFRLVARAEALSGSSDCCGCGGGGLLVKVRRYLMYSGLEQLKEEAGENAELNDLAADMRSH